jgi:hypothetical protein
MVLSSGKHEEPWPQFPDPGQGPCTRGRAYCRPATHPARAGNAAGDAAVPRLTVGPGGLEPPTSALSGLFAYGPGRRDHRECVRRHTLRRPDVRRRCCLMVLSSASAVLVGRAYVRLYSWIAHMFPSGSSKKQ